jgi:hypothetical protein
MIKRKAKGNPGQSPAKFKASGMCDGPSEKLAFERWAAILANVAVIE